MQGEPTRVVPVRCKTGLARGRLRARYVHRVVAMAAVFENNKARYAAIWLCGQPGTTDAIVVTEPAGHGEICPRCTARSEGPVVYRFFDSKHRLLYVGATVDMHRRFAEHEVRAPWWPQVYSVETRRFPDLSAAYAAEQVAIRVEAPLHNNAAPDLLTVRRHPVAIAIEEQQGGAA